MTRGKWLSGLAMAFGVGAVSLNSVVAQLPQNPSAPPANQAAPNRPARDQLPQPVYRVAQQQPQQEPATVAANTNNNIPGVQPAQAEHPLMPALQIAYTALNGIRTNIRDYSATMVKHERINGKLAEQEFMFVKIRHEPFSVYMYFLGPDKLRGQECLYVAGKNNGNMLAHGVGIRKIAGTVPLSPTGALAMAGQRYPITEIGVLNLSRRLIEVGEHDKNFGECDVKFFKGAKINKRSCMCIQVVHPVPRKEFKFNMARIYIDDEYQIPVRYEAYDWPEKPGGQPQLLEEYTYTDVKLNNGFTDFDFDETNTQYHFH